MSGKSIIYIKLSGREGPKWRPVEAEPCGPDLYRIVATNPAPDKEPWPFATGDVVHCEPYELTDSDLILVATVKVDPGAKA